MYLSLCVYVHVHAVSTCHRLHVVVRGQSWMLVIHYHSVGYVCLCVCVYVQLCSMMGVWKSEANL